MMVSKIALLILIATTASASAVPIWELLSHQEKMGRVMYVLMHLVDQYCKQSNIPDCEKVLTLYGMSNLVNEGDGTLNVLDPYHRDSKVVIWDRIMKGDFKLPTINKYDNDDTLQQLDSEDYNSLNEVDGDSFKIQQLFHKNSPNVPHPYAVRVPAPVKLFPVTTTTTTTTTTIPPIPSIYTNSLDINTINDSGDLLSSNNVIDNNIDRYSKYLDSVPEDKPGRHPYAVRALPSHHVPSGILPSADFEPLMTESQSSNSYTAPRVSIPAQGRQRIYKKRNPTPRYNNPWVRSQSIYSRPRYFKN